MNYDTVIFDLDGTLLDSLRDLMESVNHALRENGLPVRTLEEVRTYVGNGMKALVQRAIPDEYKGNEKVFEKVFAAHIAYYADHNSVYTRPYEGIPELLEHLKAAGVRMAIVSNKNDANVQVLNRRWFNMPMAVGDREGLARKPQPDGVHFVMRSFNADPARTLYVGDSEVDVLTARNAKVDCAAVLWGFRTREELASANPEHLIGTAQELENFILG